MQRFANLVLDTSGNAVASATVTVYTAGTTIAAQLFSDNVFTAQANPVIAGADGSFAFYARNGRYDLSIVKAGFSFGTTTQNDIVLFDQSSSITLAVITTTTNDYNPPNGLNTSIWRVSTTAAQNLTGIVAGLTGQFVTMLNVGASVLNVQNNNAGSGGANRILTRTGADTTIASNSSMILVYDSGGTWRQVS